MLAYETLYVSALPKGTVLDCFRWADSRFVGQVGYKANFSLTATSGDEDFKVRSVLI
jgi:hypothetical protein